MPVCRYAGEERRRERTPPGGDPTHAARLAGAPCIAKKPCGPGGRCTGSRREVARAWLAAALAWNVAATACTTCSSTGTLHEHVSTHDERRYTHTARTTLGAAIAACHAECVQEELDVPRHSFYIVCADMHGPVVPNDDRKLSVRLAGALQGASHGQVGERRHIESYTGHSLSTM